ncbi:MAG: hypothetical protein GX899_04745 [Rikenellaceae bacterium]|jgi:16S rRNA processing protein RimM|nr:hypothetical protein [Rikenellaceae bacterium]
MIQIAKILRSDNTDGGILVGSEYALEELAGNEPVYIEFDGLKVPFFVLSCEPRGRKYVLHLNDVISLKDAEEIVGRAIYADVEEEEDEQDFIGWRLYDIGPAANSAVAASDSPTSYDSTDEKPSSRTKPILVGTIIGIEAIPGNDLLVVERDGTEVLIPLHEDLIVSVNPKKEELLLDLPEGLY